MLDSPHPIDRYSDARSVAISGIQTPAGQQLAAELEARGVTVRAAESWSSETPDLLCAVHLHDPAFGPSPYDPVDRPLVTDMAHRMARRGHGRLVLVTGQVGHRVCSPTRMNDAATAASDTHWWRYLASASASRGVIANTVQVGYAPFAGASLSEAAEAELLRSLALRRPAVVSDVRAAVQFLGSRSISFVVGDTLPVDGGLGLHHIPAPTRKVGSARACTQSMPELSASLHGKVVLVVGSSSGIGRHIALDCAKEGACVALVARSGSAIEDLAGQITASGGRALAVAGNAAERSTFARALEQTDQTLGPVDVLIYAAGRYPDAGETLGSQGWRKTFAANFDGLATASESLASYWIKRKRSGSILSVASVSSWGVPVPAIESYVASKSAAAQYTRSLALSLGRYGIRANTVQPGIVQTPMTKGIGPEFQKAWTDRIPAARVGTPDDVSATSLFLASDAAAYITGAALNVDGGFHLGRLPALAISDNGEHCRP